MSIWRLFGDYLEAIWRLFGAIWSYLELFRDLIKLYPASVLIVGIVPKWQRARELRRMRVVSLARHNSLTSSDTTPSIDTALPPKATPSSNTTPPPNTTPHSTQLLHRTQLPHSKRGEMDNGNRSFVVVVMIILIVIDCYYMNVHTRCYIYSLSRYCHRTVPQLSRLPQQWLTRR